MTKQTILHDSHIDLKAKMVDFAGWHMPVQYTSIIDEHKAVRNSVGIFDVSHMGEIIVEGKDAHFFLDSLVPQNVSALTNSKAVYCQLTNTNGGIIDDLIIYRLCEGKYLIVANASRIDEDINWISNHALNYDVKIINESHNYSMIAVQGPNACEFISKHTNDELPSFFSIKDGRVFDVPLWISRTGYTGEDGVELIMKNKYAVFVWKALIEKGKEYNLVPVGLGARDTLRLEAALPLYGNDLTESTTPIEAGLKWSVPKDKNSDYSGKTVIEEQLVNGMPKKLIGLKMLDRGIARHGYKVFYNGENIGIITSGCFSPTREDNIAMAYIKNLDNLSVGSTIQVMIREKLYNAEVIEKPFVAKRNKQ